jgi:pilus assembly protein Flp/PilA
MKIAHALHRFARRMIRDRRAASAVEYALIIGLVVLAMMLALGNVAGSTIRMWDFVSGRVVNAG